MQKRILIGFERHRKKRVYVVEQRRWCFFPWTTIGIYDKRNKAVDKYFHG